MCQGKKNLVSNCNRLGTWSEASSWPDKNSQAAQDRHPIRAGHNGPQSISTTLANSGHRHIVVDFGLLHQQQGRPMATFAELVQDSFPDVSGERSGKPAGLFIKGNGAAVPLRSRAVSSVVSSGLM